LGAGQAEAQLCSGDWGRLVAVAVIDPTPSERRTSRGGRSSAGDHIAATVDTLVLAYARASRPLVLVFTRRSLAAVPVTTGLAAFVITRGNVPAPPARRIRPPATATPGPPTQEPEPVRWDQFAPDDRTEF
jgi:hypothetical protein